MASKEVPTTYYVDHAADVEIRDGMVRWVIRAGGFEFELVAPPCVLLESIHRSTSVYNAFAAENCMRAVALLEDHLRH